MRNANHHALECSITATDPLALLITATAMKAFHETEAMGTVIEDV